MEKESVKILGVYPRNVKFPKINPLKSTGFSWIPKRLQYQHWEEVAPQQGDTCDRHFRPRSLENASGDYVK